MDKIISLAHGNGGVLTHELIDSIFKRYFDNPLLSGDDSACFDISGRAAFTTDTFVVSPLFFRGGDIGKLSICGTVNDLACVGAKPLYISCGFIIEEGFEVEKLDIIAKSMADTAKECGVSIVCGDTKVVQKGMCDGVYINTSGIGVIEHNIVLSGSNAKAGDAVIVTGGIGEHACTIMLEREFEGFNADISSDCAPLWEVAEAVFGVSSGVRLMRDPTRGGLATTLCEIAQQSRVGIELDENAIPVADSVRGFCSILGIDPLYMACEGRMIIVADSSDVDKILTVLGKTKNGKDSRVIGKITAENEGILLMRTATGTRRQMGMLSGHNLPRIC